MFSEIYEQDELNDARIECAGTWTIEYAEAGRLNLTKKIENCILLIPKGNSTVVARAAPGDLGLKSHPKDYQQKLTYHYGHSSKYKPRPMLFNPSALGGWP